MADTFTPTIEWVGSPNFTPGRGGRQPLIIVDHVMCGTELGTDSWFENPASQVSAHYGVARDGRIHQYVREEDTAWHAGLVRNPSWPLYDQYAGHINQISIGIEHEGYPGEPLTDKQYAATLWLHKYLTRKWSIPADRLHIIGHCELDTVTRRDCPGPAFPFDRLIADLRPAPAKPVGGDDEMKATDLPVLRRGVTGHATAVRVVQGVVGAEPDGVFGPATERAVKDWQARHGLLDDGVVGPKTWAAIWTEVQKR